MDFTSSGFSTDANTGLNTNSIVESGIRVSARLDLTLASNTDSGTKAEEPKSWEQKYQEEQSYIFNNFYSKDILEHSDFSKLTERYSGHINSENDYLMALKETALSLHDPWTEFTSDQEIEQDRQHSKEGIRSTGIWVKPIGQDFVVENLLYGFPAYTSNLHIGDKLLSINGKSLAGLPLSEVEPMLSYAGQVGEKIKLEFETPEKQQQSLELTLSNPEIPPSSAEIIEDPQTGKKVLDLKLLAFNRQSCDQLEDAIEAIPQDQFKSISGIILDLRGNEGGFLPPIVRVADMFLNGGNIYEDVSRKGVEMVKVEGFPESSYTIDAGRRKQLRELPLDVMINGTTRSAAETLTAGLRDRGRVDAVVGMKSFGKSVVYFDLDAPGGNLRISTDELKTPSGFGWHGKGLQPDIVVDNPRFNFHDVQLDRTLEAISSEKNSK